MMLSVRSPMPRLRLVRSLALAAVCLAGATAAAAAAGTHGARAAKPGPASSAASAPGASAAVTRLHIVGGLANVKQYTQHEAPFWTQRLGALTQGQVQAEIVPFDRAGIRGQNMLRLLKLGVVPFGTALLSLTLTEDPVLGAPDLAGVSPDMATLRNVVAAYRPVLAQRLRERYDSELLAVYAYPAQVVYCKQPFARLDDLAGRRVRVSSVLQADMMSGLGATPLFTQFADLLPQMRSGALDCAITGTMSGHSNGLYQVTSHLHTLPINWGLSIFVANAAAWAALPPGLRALLREQLPLLEQSIWQAADQDTSAGVACNSGAVACTPAAPGHMTVVPASADDRVRMRSLLAEAVLPRWVQRCGPACAEAWNRTLAPVVGLAASP